MRLSRFGISVGQVLRAVVFGGGRISLGRREVPFVRGYEGRIAVIGELGSW